jgi:hypothetical protein
MDAFHLRRDSEVMTEILPSKEKVQFIFDDDSNKSLLREF